MTLYSILPEERVMEGYESFSPSYMDLTVNGISMQVELCGPNQARVVRLFSGNANDYLNPAYAPGSLLEFHPEWRG